MAQIKKEGYPAESTVNSMPFFDKERHIKYHLRCLKTFLPSAYESNDSNRMLLAFFTVSALDLLDALYSHTTLGERSSFVDWVYHCQLSTGGFRSFPGSNFGEEKRTVHNEYWDPANVAGTYSALQLLLLLGDDLTRVRRREALAWLKSLQWKDGSFGEFRGLNGRPEGGRDIRYCYMATAIRHILCSEVDIPMDDIDAERLVQFVLASQTYEGGFGKQPFNEAHAGWTYCGVSTLALLGRLPRSNGPAGSLWTKKDVACMSAQNLSTLEYFLVSRQAAFSSEDEDQEAEESGEQQESGGFQVLQSRPAGERDNLGPLKVNPNAILCAGFNGRCNKALDSCYSFWTIAAVDILDHLEFVDLEANCRFLLEKTQHLVGGFSKLAGDPPDVMHSSLGLAGLALTKTFDLKPLDPSLAISVEARERLERLPWKRRKEER